MADRPRLLFVVTEDWYFVSHRLELARAAREAGFEVAVATRVGNCAERIVAAGVELIPLRFMRRSSRNPVVELRAIAELAAVYRRWQPAITHHVAAKPVIYGGLAARRAGVPAVVSALAGLGYAYASPRRRARAMRPALLAAYRRALRHPHSRLIVQNPEDEAIVIEQRLAPRAAVRRVRGSGVDTGRFTPSDESDGPVTFALASRMLWDKGVGEFVSAARMLRSQGVDARFVLVGNTDPENPAAIPSSELKRWHAEGAVEWWGTAATWPKSSGGSCRMPSFASRGLPKVAAAAAAAR
jgi:glycosyltransferase involved in cell wall biosynthesis